MSVCKFFLEGRCRYGDNCRFEHPRGGAQRSLFGDDNWQRREGQRVAFRDSFNSSGQNDRYKWSADSQQNQGNAAQQSSLDVVSTLPKDIEILETSKMWPLTCMGLEGNSPSIPDFYDISCEELRHEAYLAMKAGNIAPYVEKYHQLMRDFTNKRNPLKHMTMEAKKKWIAFLDNARREISQGSKTAPPIGNPTQSPSSLFNQPNANSSFGASSGLFGKPNKGSLVNSSPGGTSLFGETPFGTSSPAQPTFGTLSPAQPTFGTSSPAQPTFGSMDPSNPGKPAATVGQSFGSATMTLFGKPVTSILGEQTTPPSNIFATTLPQKPSLLGPGTPQPQKPSLLGPGTPQPQKPSLLGPGTPQPQKPSLLGPGPLQPHNTSIFATGLPQPNNTSIFAPGPTQHNSNIFAQATPQQSVGSFSSSTTFATAPSTGMQFGQSAPAVPKPQSMTTGLYTPLASLNDQEKEAFMSKSFQLGKIPLRPPPVELIS